MDACWRIDTLVNESDPYDYWNINSWATVDAVGNGYETDYAWIHVDRDAGPTFYWNDWSPKSTISQECGARALGITALGFGLSFGYTQCEKWILTKYVAAGELKVQYDGNSGDAREVALMSSIKENGAGGPVWGISYNFQPKCAFPVGCW